MSLGFSRSLFGCFKNPFFYCFKIEIRKRMRGKGKLAPLLSLLAVSAIMVVDQCCGQPDLDFDVVVFGGTVAGIGAAAGAAVSHSN